MSRSTPPRQVLVGSNGLRASGARVRTGRACDLPEHSPAPAAAGTPPPATRRPDLSGLRRRQLGHDIHHELGTIMMLASLLSTAPDVGRGSRQRARLILGEARWLDQLYMAYEETVDEETTPWPQSPPSTRLDVVAAEVLDAIQQSTMTKIHLTCEVASARTDRLTFWRAFRNIVDNAVRAAGPDGHVTVEITNVDGWVVIQIDDDGPGFGAITPGRSSLGLTIVQQMVSAVGGQLEIRRGELGGCCVRMQVPSAPPDQLAAV